MAEDPPQNKGAKPTGCPILGTDPPRIPCGSPTDPFPFIPGFGFGIRKLSILNTRHNHARTRQPEGSYRKLYNVPPITARQVWYWCQIFEIWTQILCVGWKDEETMIQSPQPGTMHSFALQPTRYFCWWEKTENFIVREWSLGHSRTIKNFVFYLHLFFIEAGALQFDLRWGMLHKNLHTQSIAQGTWAY